MIRELSAQDLEGLRHFIEIEVPDIWTWSFNKLEQSLKIDKTVCVAESGRVRGILVFSDRGPQMELLWIWTPPEERGQGVARHLLQWLIAEAKQKLCPIWLETHELNSKAQNLYIGLGFKKVGIRPAYYQDGAAAFLYEYDGLP